MRTLTTEHMRPHEFRKALEAAAVGDKIVYAVGELGRSIDIARRGAVCDLQQETMDAWYDGKAYLLQRRVGLNLFAYIAVKADGKRKRERPTWNDGFEGGGGRRSEDGANRRDREKARRATAAGMEMAV